MASLQHYHQKRRFTHTPEPKGKLSTKTDGKHHFVVQMHAASHLHYDFRLECKGVLKSWAVPKGPSLDPSIKRLAVEVEDHPLEYKDFEGVIPKGEYGGGTVMVWDEGSWEEIDDGKSLENGNAVKFILHGKKLKGKWKLIRIKNGKNWLLIKAKDEEACSSVQYDIVSEENLSVVTGRTLNEIKHDADASWSSKKKKTQMKSKKETRTYVLPKKVIEKIKIKKIPNHIKPQLATLVAKPPQGEDWIHEMKFDGYRLLAMIHSEVTLMTRGLQN